MVSRVTWQDYEGFLNRIHYERGASPLVQAVNDPTAFVEKQRRLTALFNARRRLRHQRRSVTKR